MGSLSLVCPMCCGESFNNPQSLKYHLLSMTDNLYCPSCSQRSDSVMALIQHLDRCGQNADSEMPSELKDQFLETVKAKAQQLMDSEQESVLDPEEKMLPVADQQLGMEPESEVELEAELEAELETELEGEVPPDPEQDQRTETEVLMDTNVEEIEQSFLATVNDNGIMIVGEPRTIEVNEHGEIKVVDKMETDVETASRICEESLNFKVVEKMSESRNRTKGTELAEDQLVALTSTDVNEKTNGKSIIAILPDGSELLDGSAEALLNVADLGNDVAELDEEGLLQVKQELCEVDSEAVYSCTSCDMSFNSVVEHIKQYHDGQEVLLEIADQLDDLPVTPKSGQALATTMATGIAGNAVNATPVEVETVANTRQRQTMNTLRTEECVDSEGRLYTRKVVQIERFWDRSPSQSTFQASKAPMIEKFFSNVEGLKVREKRIATSPMRMYRCNQCLQQFSKLGNFRVHACLNGNNRCDSCDQTFATSKALQLHAKVHEGEPDPNQKSFVCETCGTEFCSHKSLRLHSRMHAPVRARHVDAPEGMANATFTCPECGKTLSESYKEAHMALHSGDSVTCTVCNRKFDSADSLAMHAAVHTELAQSHSPTTPLSDLAAELASGEPQKPYQCQHCGRRFTRPHEKVKHERIHTGEKPHACEVCGKTFRVSYCLTLHMRTHTGVRPYACQHCGKRFKASSVYNHHLLTHGEERAYTCPYCPKTFKTRVQLAGHKNSHTKPFRCTECSRPFASLYAARAHIQTHKKDNNLKFSCYICGASYGRAFALKDHLKQHGQDAASAAAAAASAAAPEPTREEEVQEAEEFLLAEVEDDEMAVPSPLPVAAHHSDVEDTE